VTPPPLEISDLIRSAGAAFVERDRQWIGWKHVKVLLAIVRCRTAALGGHLDESTSKRLYRKRAEHLASLRLF
jgi:hypothetical protein